MFRAASCLLQAATCSNSAPLGINGALAEVFEIFEVTVTGWGFGSTFALAFNFFGSTEAAGVFGAASRCGWRAASLLLSGESQSRPPNIAGSESELVEEEVAEEVAAAAAVFFFNPSGLAMRIESLAAWLGGRTRPAHGSR